MAVSLSDCFFSEAKRGILTFSIVSLEGSALCEA